MSSLDDETRALWRAAGTGDVQAARLFLARLLRARDRSGHVTETDEKLWKDELALIDLLGVPLRSVHEEARLVVESYLDDTSGSPRWRVNAVNRSSSDLRAGARTEGAQILRGARVAGALSDPAVIAPWNGYGLGLEVFLRGDGTLTFDARESGGPMGPILVGRAVRVVDGRPGVYDVVVTRPEVVGRIA